VESTAAPNVDALALPQKVRRFVGGYEMVSGVFLMILSAFAGGAWWTLTMLEGLAAISFAAGYWLWKDDARGFALSRTLQIAQLIRVQSPWITYVATSGVFLDLYDANGSVGINPGFSSALRLAWMPEQSFGIAVNLWAALLLLVLLHARPHTGSVETEGDALAAEPSVTPVA
jgi:hypothetical protein